MTILFVALFPALLIFLIAVWWESKAILTIAAIIACVIGVKTGNPVYMALDLVAVAIGYVLGWLFINSQKPYAFQHIEKTLQTSDSGKKDSSWGMSILVLVVIALIFFNKNSDKSLTTHPVSPVPHKVGVPEKPIQPLRPKQTVHAKTTGIHSNKEADSNSKSHCFNLPTDSELLQCLN